MKRTTVIYGFVMLLIATALAACAGFDLGDVVRVKTPNAIQQTTGLSASVTLNEAEQEYLAWFTDTQRVGANWKANIEKGDEVRSMLNQLTLSALNDVGPMVAGVPVLGPALPAVAGIAGLFLGSGRLRKEKEASFNKGLDKGQTASEIRGPP